VWSGATDAREIRLRYRHRFQEIHQEVVSMRFCFTFEIQPGTEAEYKRRHDEIWPELVAVIKDAGVSNYSLFRRGTQVTAYCECEPDVATAFAKIGESEANARWSEYFEDVIVSLTDENGELFVAQEVWHLD
jgi:L-rhamnose mutarotase